MKRKLFCLLLVGILFVSLCISPVTASNTFSFDSELERATAYVEAYIGFVEGISVEAEFVDDLYTTQKPGKIGMLFAINSSGYAVLGTDDYNIYEYSLSSPNPYEEFTGSTLYYDGISSYYAGQGSAIINILTGESFSLNAALASSVASNPLQSFHAVTENLTESEKSAKVSAFLNATSQSVTRAGEESGSLTRALSTATKSGDYCGEIAAHCMLQYRGFHRSDLTGVQNIEMLRNFVASNPSVSPAVNLDSLRNGINAYLVSRGYYSISVASSAYSFNRIRTEIGNNRPLTLGTNGGGLITGGHVQAVHGWKVQYPSASFAVYTIYVNSWGQNNRAISYTNAAPAYLKDHVYYLS